MVINMSFSSEVKRELLERQDSARHCSLALLAAFISCEGVIELKDNIPYLYIKTENEVVVEKTAELIKKLFKAETDVRHEKDRKTYILSCKKAVDCIKVLSACGFMSDGRLLVNLNPVILSSFCCRRAFIRAAFICSGSLSNPHKNYHLEFVCHSKHQAELLMNTINSFDIVSKLIERKGNFVVYIKESEQISDVLNIMNAHKALLKLENVVILKDVRNNVNRIVNCETANLNKTVCASVAQRENINYIIETVGIDYLPAQLKETALLRLDFPDLSLKELGEKLSPSVGKSGVNHRLKKINSIAENLRRNRKW